MFTRTLITSVMTLLILVTMITPPQASASSSLGDDIVATAKLQLGVPYQFGGTSPTTGFDCSGFIGHVYMKNGITLPRTASEQYQAGVAVAKSDLQVGDLVFFETYKPGPSHSGIYIGDNQFISAKSSKGIAIASVNDPYYWASRYLGARRILTEEVAGDQQVLAALPTGDYHDISDTHWAYTEIKEISKRGIVNGYEHNLFKPDELVTRAQAAVMLANALGLTNSSTTSIFPDVPSQHWAAGDVFAVYEAGLIKGYQDKTFKPNAVLTRDEVAMLFVRAFNLAAAENEAIVAYEDVAADSWAYDPIQRLSASGITKGFEDGSFRPKDQITRAQFTVFLHRALK